MNINPQLLDDTVAVCTSSSATIMLMNDNRWPWLILVPNQSQATELHDLTHTDRNAFMADINQVSRVVHKVTNCQSINIAMLGNVVSQLHCHVVARSEGDPNWPRPVWGFEQAVHYQNDLPENLLDAIRKSFS
ncbi:MAG: HIT family protein [Granulosicoccus sp.]|nr:HIT family protein [Granulosicoccus sp.]